MSCDIHIFAEYKNKQTDKWEIVEDDIFSSSGYSDDGIEYLTPQPFNWRSYVMFSIFADVRNRLYVTPISDPKGLPLDSEYLNTSRLNVWEKGGEAYIPNSLRNEIYRDLDFHTESYITLSELLRYDYDQIIESEDETLREYLNPLFFKNIEEMKTLGEPEDVRIVFYFDN